MINPQFWKASLQTGKVLALLAGISWLAAGPVSAQQGDFFRQRLVLSREFGDALFHDLAGTGNKDMVVVEVDGNSRERFPYLKVFRQGNNGYEAIPAADSVLPPDLAMAGTGRFPFGAGLVLLTPGRVEIWPWREDHFQSQEAVRINAENIFLYPGGGLKTGLKWIEDLNGDGFDEVIVPRLDGFQVLRHNGQGELEIHATLGNRTKSRFWFNMRQQYIAFELPVANFVDTDGNGWKDVVTFNDGILSLFLLDDTPRPERSRPTLERDLQQPVPFDPKKPRDPPMKLVLAQDLNGNGRLDLVFTKNSAPDDSFRTSTRVLVFYGKQDPASGSPDFATTPSQLFTSEGYTLPILLDMDNDKLIDLVLVNVETTWWNAVRGFIAGSVPAQAAFFPMGKEGVFPKTPQGVVDYTVNFSRGRYSHKPIAAFADLNSDGLPELLLSENKDGLGIHWGVSKKFWSTGYDFLLKEFLPINRNGLRVTDLDGDGRDDLVFLYRRDDIRQMPEVDRKITVLFSRFPSRKAGGLVTTP